MTAFNNKEQPKIILVMGVTGAGKSYLIREISNQQVQVGNKLESCTKNITRYDFEFEGSPFAILDTPGFDDTHRSDTEILMDITGYLVELYKSGQGITGIIYLHSILDTRMRGTSLKNLELFGILCGKRSFKNVMMLTGRWADVDLPTGAVREKELEDRFWKPYLDNKCAYRRYKDKENLESIFRELQKMPPLTLKIQHEMVVEKKPLDQTEAGLYINKEIEKEKKKHQQDIEGLMADYAKQSVGMKALADEERLQLETRLMELEAAQSMLKGNQPPVDHDSEMVELNNNQRIDATAVAGSSISQQGNQNRRDHGSHRQLDPTGEPRQPQSRTAHTYQPALTQMSMVAPHGFIPQTSYIPEPQRQAMPRDSHQYLSRQAEMTSYQRQTAEEHYAHGNNRETAQSGIRMGLAHGHDSSSGPNYGAAGNPAFITDSSQVSQLRSGPPVVQPLPTTPRNTSDPEIEAMQWQLKISQQEAINLQQQVHVSNQVAMDYAEEKRPKSLSGIFRKHFGPEKEYEAAAKKAQKERVKQEQQSRAQESLKAVQKGTGRHDSAQ